jgi:hypothetical protein
LAEAASIEPAHARNVVAALSIVARAGMRSSAVRSTISTICRRRDLRGARAALSKLAEGCQDDSELQDALFFIAGMIGATAAVQRLWELATDRKPERTDTNGSAGNGSLPG